MSVNTSTAKTVSYVFLALASASFLLSIYFALEKQGVFSMAPSTQTDWGKNLMIFAGVCLLGSASAGMAYKSQISGDIKTPTILNFVCAILASLLVGYGAYKGWEFLALCIATLIGILTCFEFIVED